MATVSAAGNKMPVLVSPSLVIDGDAADPSANSTVADPVTVNVPATASVLPAPTFNPTLVPVPLAVKTASKLSKSVLIFVPHVSVLAPTSGLVNKRLVVVVSAIFYPYAACCHDVELSAISVQVSVVSDSGVHVSAVSDTGDHVSGVSDWAVQVSDVSGTAPHPNPTITPADPTASLPIIATEMTFDALPTSPAPETPVMAWNEITSADMVPTAPVAALPVVAVDRVTPTEPTELVETLPAIDLDLIETTLPTDAVDEFPEIDTVFEFVTVPTLPVAMTPSSCSDMFTSKLPTAVADALPVMANDVVPRLTDPTAVVDAFPVMSWVRTSTTDPTDAVDELPVMAWVLTSATDPTPAVNELPVTA
jgi:hypothetical protein